MCTAAGAEYILPALIIGGLSAGGAVASAAVGKQDIPQLPKPGGTATTPQEPGKIKYGSELGGASQQNRLRKGKGGLTIPMGTSTTGSPTGAPSTGVGY